MSGVRTPQQNGRVERFHKTFKRILAARLSDNPDMDIDDAILMSLFTYK